MGEALSGVKVLDFTDGVAGSYCAKLLADFGAEVIKVEAPNGSELRSKRPFLKDEPHPEKSGAFFYLNTNKKGITLNLKDTKGIEICRRLVKDADVVVESFAPGAMDKMGCSYEALKGLNDRLIMASITWFGQDGPYRDHGATNLIAEGISGAMFTARQTRWPKDRPSVLGGCQAEYRSGLVASTAILASLINRAMTDKGTWIDLSIVECVTSTLAGIAADYPYMGFSRTTVPWAIHGYPTQENHPCKDGWINNLPGIGAVPDIADLIEKPELKEDPLFSKPGARLAEPEKFEALFTPYFKEHSKWEIMKKAQKMRLAFSPTLSPGELFEDEQLKAREAFHKVEHPVLGEVTYFGAPAKLSETPGKKGRAPLLGEHNDVVYKAIGYTEQELTILKEQGII